MSWITGADIIAQPGAPDVTVLQANNAADAACAFIERWTNRAIEPVTYYEWVDRLGAKTVLVDNPPVRRLRLVSVDTADAMWLLNTNADAARASVSIQDGEMHLSVQGGVNAGDETLTLATHGTMALLLAAAVALGKGWSGTVTVEGNPQNLKPEHFGSVLVASEHVHLPGDAADASLIDAEGGLLFIDSTWSDAGGLAFVGYDGGYATVPDDLNQLTLELGVDILNSDALSSVLQSESLDKYAWTRRTDVPDLRTAYKSRLQPWKREYL